MSRTTPHRATQFDGVNKTTPVLLNEVYSRLIASATAYESCASRINLKLISRWINTYAERLKSMSAKLGAEGAVTNKEFSFSARALQYEQENSTPDRLLKAAEENQQELIKKISLLTNRLDMDADLYEILVDQHNELKESLHDIQDLRREYEAYY